MRKTAQNPFAEEIKDTKLGYDEEYEPSTWKEQLEILSGFYPELDSSHVSALVRACGKLPEGAELIQVSPKMSALGKGLSDPYGADCAAILEILLSNLKPLELKNHAAKVLNPQQYQLLSSARKVQERLEKETPGDFLVFPIQSGILYAGYSTNAGRWAIEASGNQWPLPSWIVGHHVLTNPDRLGADLWLDCPGDEVRLSSNGHFEDSTYFFPGIAKLHFSYGALSTHVDSCAPASGFLVAKPKANAKKAA